MSSWKQLKEPGARKKAEAKIICCIQVILNLGPLLDLTKQKMNLARTLTLNILPLLFVTFFTSNSMQREREHGCC